MRLASLLFALAGLSGCDAIKFNNWRLRHRFARQGLVSHTAELPSGRMHYYDGGSGAPLLLLHGFGFGAVENWEKQGPAFAKHRRVIAPDFYWFGQSVPSGPCESVRAQAEAVVELLDALGLGRVDVVGASFGGLIALHLAIGHPDRVGRLVLVDAAGVRPTRDELDRIGAGFGGQSRVEDLLMPTDLAALKQFLERVVYRTKPPLPDWVLRQVMRELSRNREAKARLCRAFSDELLDDAALARVAARTLVIWGRNDPLLLLSMGERLAKAIRGAEMIVFEDAAHSAMLERPARFNQTVLRFLEQR